MAYEEKGEIRFIAFRSGGEAGDESPIPLSGAALQEASDAAAKNGGRVWLEPGAAEQVCSFTLAGRAPNTVQQRTRKRSGWRPAQPEAVWSMRSQGDASRFWRLFEAARFLCADADPVILRNQFGLFIEPPAAGLERFRGRAAPTGAPDRGKNTYF